MTSIAAGSGTQPTVRTWFITGATSGIGRALAIAALERGDNVTVLARRTEQLSDLAAEHAERALVIETDVRDEESVRAAVQRTLDRFGRIDVVANNAGFGLFGAVEEPATPRPARSSTRTSSACSTCCAQPIPSCASNVQVTCCRAPRTTGRPPTPASACSLPPSTPSRASPTRSSARSPRWASRSPSSSPAPPRPRSCPTSTWPTPTPTTTRPSAKCSGRSVRCHPRRSTRPSGSLPPSWPPSTPTSLHCGWPRAAPGPATCAPLCRPGSTISTRGPRSPTPWTPPAWRDATPDAVAIRAYRADAPPTYISYGEYARHVERFAGALYELGVRPGQVVALQLPNWWQAGALILATARLGAVLAPIMTTIRSRELGRILERVGANVCISVDQWARFDHAAALREIAPRLPQLRHRVIVGGPAAEEEIDFGPFFEDTPWEQRHPVGLVDTEEDPDRVAVVYFTSGTSGEPKGALHTSNTVYAGLAAMTTAERIGSQDVLFTPHALMHLMGQINLLIPLLTGGCAVLLDSWSGNRGLTLLAETGTTIFMAAPAFYDDLIAAAGGERQDLPALRMPLTGVTNVPRRLIPEAHRLLGRRHGRRGG